jgi:hypothetical protein
MHGRHNEHKTRGSERFEVLTEKHMMGGRSEERD